MTFTIDDNLRDVLEDITTSKKSALFAGTYLKNIHEAYTIPEGRFAALRLGMGSAERHLLETYRSELSMVLLQGFYKNFFEVEEFASKVHNLGELPAAEPLEERARFARDSAPRDAFVGKTTHWLRRLLEGRPIAKAEDLESMLTAAIGLRDRPEARVYMGAVRFGSEDWRGAVTCVRPVLDADGGVRRMEARQLVSSSLDRCGFLGRANRLSASCVSSGWRLGLFDHAVVELGSIVVREFAVGSSLELTQKLVHEFPGLGSMARTEVGSRLSTSIERGVIPGDRRERVFLQASDALGVQVEPVKGA